MARGGCFLTVLCGTVLISALAHAADLGGNCCADLEAKISELEQTTARKGNRRVSLTLYGQLSEALLFWNDRAGHNAYVVTNQTTKNLLGLAGEAAISPELRTGFRIEWEAGVAPSDAVDQRRAVDAKGNVLVGFGDRGSASIDDPFAETRLANWWVQHRTLGRLTVGYVPQATSYMAEIDLSGSDALAQSGVDSWNGGFFLRNRQGISPLIAGGSFIYADLFWGNLDGTRVSGLRYDSQSLAGFFISGSWSNGNEWDLALRYAAQFAGFRFAGGIGYREGWGDFANRNKDVLGSGSLIHDPSGLFLTFSGGARNWRDEDTLANVGERLSGEKYAYVKTGIFRDFIPLGKTALYAEYYRAWDVGVDNPSAPELKEAGQVWGGGIVQHVSATETELYLGYRRYQADHITDYNTRADFDVKMDVVMSGVRVRF